MCFGKLRAHRCFDIERVSTAVAKASKRILGQQVERIDGESGLDAVSHGELDDFRAALPIGMYKSWNIRFPLAHDNGDDQAFDVRDDSKIYGR